MSLVIDRDAGVPVHFPRNKDVFRFDDEVAIIFEDMAQRSIPMYSEAHRLHLSLVKDKIMECRSSAGGCTFFDIGGSTGKWLDAMCKGFEVSVPSDMSNCHFYVYDSSRQMIGRVKDRFPDITADVFDLTKPFVVPQKADIVTMFYVLQFIPDADKHKAMQWVYDHMNPGGVLLMGQKEKQNDTVTEETFQEEYIRFRLANGYTREEIQAKTQALKNSMWCSTSSDLWMLLKDVGFGKVRETSRWLSFSTLMVSK